MKKSAVARPPAGLALLFKTIEPPCSSAGLWHATAAYPLAKRIVEAIHDHDLEDVRERVFGDAVEAMFPKTDDQDQDESMAVNAGFSVGFAACWLLLKQMADETPAVGAR